MSTTNVQSDMKVYALPADEVFEALGTGPQGLTKEEAAQRLEQYGRNAIQEAKGTPLIVKFLSNFTSVMAMLLWAGILSHRPCKVEGHPGKIPGVFMPFTKPSYTLG
jgi:magnesium-transporting ATPase (P-type)